MATKKLKIDDLQIGMHLELQGSWIDHPFLRSSFRIESEEQIAALKKHGFRAVPVDLAKSAIKAPPREPPAPETVDPREQAAAENWTPETLVPPELADAMEDQRLPPEEKSKLVYRHSVEMMKRLLECPSADNIQTSKKAISTMADLILADDQTAANLMRITSHDFYTYTHSVNVGVMSILLAKELFSRSDAHDLQELGAGFFLHDLGKVRVDSAIINKPGRLTEEEMQRMRVHPYQGYKILEEAEALSKECAIIVMQHHENDDGTGYPRHLKKEEIHLYGRICGIADVFDALTAERSYKRAMTSFDALKLMKGQMSKRFDTELFSAFVRLFEKSRQL